MKPFDSFRGETFWTVKLRYIRILNRCASCRFGVCPFISSKQRVCWLAKRQSLIAWTKIITGGNFRIQRECSIWPNRRSDPGAIYFQLLYGLPFRRGLSLHQQQTESILVGWKQSLKACTKFTDKGTNPETTGRTAIENIYKEPKILFSSIAYPNPPAIGRLKENIKRKIKRIPKDMLKRVIDNFNVSVTRVI